jgi:hypothetical protein
MLPVITPYLDLAKSILGLLTALVPFLLLKKSGARALKKA